MIQHNKPTLGRAEQEAAARVLSSGWVAQGPEVDAFESEICDYMGLPDGHAVALASGTAALFAALWVLQARAKRVAVPVYSCAAVRNAVVMAGGEPVLIDVAADSPNIDLQRAVESRADIIIAAHMFGNPVRCASGYAPISIIEDCAQAFGARIDGRPVGTNGAVGVFSFYATKMITSGGQGGMLVSPDRGLVDAVRDYRQFDSRHDRKPRFNLQMTDLQAAIGRAQLSQIGRFIATRKETVLQYAAAGLPLWPVEQAPGTESCNYRAILRVPNPHDMIARFAQDSIRAIVPIADWELLGDAREFPNSMALAGSTVSVPVHPSLAPHEVSAVIKSASASAQDAATESV